MRTVPIVTSVSEFRGCSDRGRRDAGTSSPTGSGWKALVLVPHENRRQAAVYLAGVFAFFGFFFSRRCLSLLIAVSMPRADFSRRIFRRVSGISTRYFLTDPLRRPACLHTASQPARTFPKPRIPRRGCTLLRHFRRRDRTRFGTAGFYLRHRSP